MKRSFDAVCCDQDDTVDADGKINGDVTITVGAAGTPTTPGGPKTPAVFEFTTTSLKFTLTKADMNLLLVILDDMVTTAT